MDPQFNAPTNRPNVQPNQPMPTVTPVQTAPMQPKMKKDKKWLKMLIALIVLLAVAGGVYFWQQKKIDDLNNKITQLNMDNYQLNYQYRDLKASLKR